ncbi:MAG TPA: hypothetical protein VLA00_03575 [Xanthobacteraceae bacterium]|nr:hypothetical protein [Xanthobacteraceae bacterium]
MNAETARSVLRLATGHGKQALGRLIGHPGLRSAGVFEQLSAEAALACQRQRSAARRALRPGMARLPA